MFESIIKFVFVLLNLSYPLFPSPPQIQLEYCKTVDQYIEFESRKNGIFIQMGRPNLFDLRIGERLGNFNWRIHKESPDKIFLDGFIENDKIPDFLKKNPKGIEFKRVFSPNGEIIATNISANQDIIPFPSGLISEGDTWQTSLRRNRCFADTIHTVFKIVRGDAENHAFIFSIGYDIRFVANLLISKAFFAFRIVSTRDGIFKFLNVNDIFLMIDFSGLSSSLMFEIEKETKNRK